MRSIPASILAYMNDNHIRVVSPLDMALLICRLYAQREYGGVPIPLRKLAPNKTDISALESRMVRDGALQRDPDSVNLLRVPGNNVSVEEICCAADACVYVSHLSAMVWHKISDRIPGTLYLTTATGIVWRDFIKKRVQKYTNAWVPSGIDLDLLPLKKNHLHDQIKRRPLNICTTKHLRRTMDIDKRHVRVSTIGETFLDTLLAPDQCGGMPYVMAVWENYASQHLEEIIESVEQAPTRIAKVRAGYLLEEYIGIVDPRIEAWRSLAQRGSSSRLDPSWPFKGSNISESWCLSINCIPEKYTGVHGDLGKMGDDKIMDYPDIGAIVDGEGER